VTILSGGDDRGAMARWRLRPPARRPYRPRARRAGPNVPRARAAQDQRDASVSHVQSQRPEAGKLPEGLDEPGWIRPLSHKNIGKDEATIVKVNPANIREARLIEKAPGQAVTIASKWMKSIDRKTDGYWISFREQVASPQEVQITCEEWKSVPVSGQIVVAVLPDGRPHTLNSGAPSLFGPQRHCPFLQSIKIGAIMGDGVPDGRPHFHWQNLS
jgi:hypothetical protein